MERALQLFTKQQYIFAVQSPVVSMINQGYYMAVRGNEYYLTSEQSEGMRATYSTRR